MKPIMDFLLKVYMLSPKISPAVFLKIEYYSKVTTYILFYFFLQNPIFPKKPYEE